MKGWRTTILASVLLASCATVPTALQGEFTRETPAQAVATGATGAAVRWGGEIIRVEPGASSTCFEILARDLDASARPIVRDPAGGRFIACLPGFSDPAEYKPGRLVTVIGKVSGFERAKVGEFDYNYAHVDARALHLWPPRASYPPTPAYWDPWWGYGPYFGPGWGGWPRHHGPVIIRPRPDPGD